ncbi:MAG: RuvA C-terminal domain-containing protein [Eubacterium sp.]
MNLRINRLNRYRSGFASFKFAENIDNSASAEAIEAPSLGYSQSDAAVVVGSLDSSMSVDEMIRYGLKELAKNL